MPTSRRLPSLSALISVVLGASALMAAAAPAAALPPGQVVFSSDRPSAGIAAPAADGSDARIWISSSPLRSPLAAPVQVTFGPTGVAQHRNPDWSSDRATIAFAVGAPVGNGDPATGQAEIRILDLATGIARPFVAAAAGQDYPAFSPDGTKVAFVAGGTLLVKSSNAQAAAPAQAMADDVALSKPSWSADGREIYFTRATAVGREIWKAAPGATTRVVAASADPASEGIDNYDPAVSPDGTALCYSRTLPDRDVPQLAKLDLGTGARTTIVTSSEPTTAGGDTFEADESCAWSPDAENVIFTATPGFPATRQGAASDLHLASLGAEALENPGLTGFNDVARFDGAADWAPDLSPRCDSKTANVVAGASVTIPLSCIDPDSGAAGQAPAPAPLGAGSLSIVSAPGSGRIDGGVRADGTVTFVAGAVAGTVTFTYSGTDGGFERRPGDRDGHRERRHRWARPRPWPRRRACDQRTEAVADDLGARPLALHAHRSRPPRRPRPAGSRPVRPADAGQPRGTRLRPARCRHDDLVRRQPARERRDRLPARAVRPPRGGPVRRSDAENPQSRGVRQVRRDAEPCAAQRLGRHRPAALLRSPESHRAAREGGDLSRRARRAGQRGASSPADRRAAIHDRQAELHRRDETVTRPVAAGSHDHGWSR